MRVDDSADGPLRLFESLEFLSLGIAGKLALWEALKAAANVSPQLQCADYDRLIQRTIEQRSRAETLRLEAALDALGKSP